VEERLQLAAALLLAALLLAAAALASGLSFERCHALLKISI
jgi:hypothetical protein